MIQWFSKNDKTAIATIYPTNITINKQGKDMLADSYACMLGLDTDDGKIAIQPISKDQYDNKEFPDDCMFVLKGSSAYIRISSTDFVNKVGEYLEYDFKAGYKKYGCYYDKKAGMLIVNLKEEIK